MNAVAAQQRNNRTGLTVALIALAMLGVAFASVPLYRLFCQVTGLGGTVRMDTSATAPGAVAGKLVSVRFDANTRGLPWTFAPEKTRDTVAIGARKLTFFTATNHSSEPVTGTATFNVTPTLAGQHFVKMQCFCFTEQTLKPGETMRMPVVYHIDPKILEDESVKDVSEITLSYTFYPVEKPGVAG